MHIYPLLEIHHALRDAECNLREAERLIAAALSAGSPLHAQLDSGEAPEVLGTLRILLEDLELIRETCLFHYVQPALRRAFVREKARFDADQQR